MRVWFVARARIQDQINTVRFMPEWVEARVLALRHVYMRDWLDNERMNRGCGREG